MRVATLFKRLLRLGRERVIGDVARPAGRRMRCPGCGHTTRSIYDRSLRSWRHLDALGTRVELRCEVRRIDCPACGVIAEEVPWARPGSRFTRSFENTCAFLARDAPKTVVARLVRIDWATVGRTVERVVDEALGDAPDARDGLRRIGVDEVAYRRGHRYLLCVVCHDTGRIVWARPGRSKATLAAFFLELGPERARRLEAVSVDLHGAWPEVIRLAAPQAAICADPFHVVKLAGEALDALRRADWQRLRAEDPERARRFKGTRFPLRRRAEALSGEQGDLIEGLAATNERVYRGWLYVDQLRAIYRAPGPAEAAQMLEDWCESARRSGLPEFAKVARTFTANAEAIVNAIHLGISNARIEAMNSTVRLMSHRSRGFRRVEPLLALIALVCGKIPVALPT
jgi:transposase